MNIPLAEKLRPQTLQDVCGQQHLLAQGMVFRSVIETGNVPNMIFYGPSGVGKTTVARIIAENSGMRLHRLNGTTTSTADIKSVISEIGTISSLGGILLYLDEIQYLNKKQQQILLECIEDGSITLIASTTENPYFYIYNAILSRSTVFEFKSLTAPDIKISLQRAITVLQQEKPNLEMDDDALEYLSLSCGGDVRKSLNCLELLSSAAVENNGKKTITINATKQVAKRSNMRYDRNADVHYDSVSGLQKSIRGSDPDAAIHYLAKILEGGDLPSACRRLLVIAAEDIGLAYPQAIPIVKACVDSALQLGMPEARIPLATATILLATSPKSNSAYMAIHLAMEDVKNGDYGNPPRCVQNQHFDGEDSTTKGQGYLYPHDYPNHWVSQEYLPSKLQNKTYYEFGDNKIENTAKAYWQKIKGK